MNDILGPRPRRDRAVPTFGIFFTIVTTINFSVGICSSYLKALRSHSSPRPVPPYITRVPTLSVIHHCFSCVGCLPPLPTLCVSSSRGAHLTRAAASGRYVPSTRPGANVSSFLITSAPPARPRRPHRRLHRSYTQDLSIRISLSPESSRQPPHLLAGDQTLI
ncbi:hypothetical protein E2C01_010820 [Portunus trituberculatus]|uniref:Uncharacterized protein n=1 Tax=Portunus trituberculatus TaxID=210409 RepID=A0A5B7D9E8_PORTR|nr:hypothetical protein [Portunus trituberculatus]